MRKLVLTAVTVLALTAACAGAAAPASAMRVQGGDTEGTAGLTLAMQGSRSVLVASLATTPEVTSVVQG